MIAAAARIIRFESPAEAGAVFVNVLLRILLVAFAVDSIVNAGADRFDGKALGPRNVLIVLGFGMLFPLLHGIGRQWREYPWWFDSLWLSIFLVDMAGNSADLYDRLLWFDLVAHFYGPGALAIALMGAGGVGPLAAAGFATMLHVLLEIGEIYGDEFLGTRNVRDIMDTGNDLMAGLLGATLFVLVYKGSEWYQHRRATPRRARRKRG